MARKPGAPRLADHLAPDSVRQLERAAGHRFDEADRLKEGGDLLIALYLYGYSVEMCLAAAYFRSVGFHPHDPIDRDTRALHMTKARSRRTPSDQPLMESDPHPLIGWARLLHWRRSLSMQSTRQARRLKQAVHYAELAYKHWRPELRYKTTQVTSRQQDEVRQAASWFIDHRGQL